MTEQAALPPQTGNHLVDAALRELTDIGAAPIGEQLDRIRAAHETLMNVLASSRGPIPDQPTGMRPQ